MSFETAIAADLTGALAFVSKAAPTVEAAVVTDFNTALAALKTAFVPVGDALVVSIIADVSAKIPLNATLAPAEIATLEAVIAQLQTYLPSS